MSNNDEEHREIMARCPTLPALYDTRCSPPSIPWDELPSDMKELIAAGFMLAYYEIQSTQQEFIYDDRHTG